jgi:chromosome segregation ATPase
MWWNRERAELKTRLANQDKELAGKNAQILDLSDKLKAVLDGIAEADRQHLALVVELRLQLSALQETNSRYSTALEECIAERDLYKRKLDHIRDHASTADSIIIREHA